MISGTYLVSGVLLIIARLPPVWAPDRHRQRPEQAAGAMILGGLVAEFQAVDAEGKALEDIAKPLSVVAKPAEAIFRATVLLPRSRPPATSPAPRVT
jgi:hypothetical protein